MKYGTYSTFDCPTQKVDEAYQFLKDEFEKIGARVRKCSNGHDFGDYPSFEIDTPTRFDSWDDDDLTEEQQETIDEWNERANEIEKYYFIKFKDYL